MLLWYPSSIIQRSCGDVGSLPPVWDAEMQLAG